jgi:hypothetical protein
MVCNGMLCINSKFFVSSSSLYYILAMYIYIKLMINNDDDVLHVFCVLFCNTVWCMNMANK